jgi:hypothetical protein
MMGFYEEMVETAAELLNEFGTIATLTTRSSEFSKEANREVTATIATEPVTVVFRKREVQDEQGRLVTRTFALSATSLTVGSTISLGSQTWSVSAVTAIQPTALPLLFIAELS